MYYNYTCIICGAPLRIIEPFNEDTKEDLITDPKIRKKLEEK